MVLPKIVCVNDNRTSTETVRNQLESMGSEVFTSSALVKLDWQSLVNLLAEYAQCEDAKNHYLGLVPTKSPTESRELWDKQLSVLPVVRLGYTPPIGELKNPRHIFASLNKGQVLDGIDLRRILELLYASRRVYSFSNDFSAKSDVLAKAKSSLNSLQRLLSAIERAISVTGEVVDEASPCLKNLRQQKTALRSKIEDSLSKILIAPDVSEYLQDNYFTIRNDRYVIPIRLDGRGRVKGVVVDTSDSGQTLFLEPPSIASMNERLRDLEVEEKLEVIRILRELSGEVSSHLGTLECNYQTLVDLDVIFAGGRFALKYNCGSANVVSEPTISLKQATHPLIGRGESPSAVANDIVLNKGQRALIVSGPNAGGKTVVLKTVGLIQAMVRAGLLIPCASDSEIFFFDHVFLEMGDGQNISANLSTFSGHLHGIKPIIEESGVNDLVLLDELATGTDPQTGSALAQATSEHLVEIGCHAIITTHFDVMKSLAFADPRFRNASMEYTLKAMRPTYRLILDTPGQSYGLELARNMGMPESVVTRASNLLSSMSNTFDRALEGLNQQRAAMDAIHAELEERLLKAEEEKDRWRQECERLNEMRQSVAETLTEKYQGQIDELKSNFDLVTNRLKKVLKDSENEDARRKFVTERQLAQGALRDLEDKVKAMSDELKPAQLLPGKVAMLEELFVGALVFVISLGKEGVVTRLPQKAGDTFDVQFGNMKVKVHLEEVRILPPKQQSMKREKLHSAIKQNNARSEGMIRVPALVLRTPTNAVDVRGMQSDDACACVIDFIDKAMMRGEEAIIVIHGHGTDTLKSAIRSMLKNDCPYETSQRAGHAQEGGDGVTIVGFTVRP